MWVTDDVMQFFDGDQLLRTEKRTTTGEIRKKRASSPRRTRHSLKHECHRSTEDQMSPINRSSTGALVERDLPQAA